MSVDILAHAPTVADPDRPPLLQVENLSAEFRTARGTLKALRGVSLWLHAGETLAILGESGSGKSVTAEIVLGILQSPPGRVTGGRVRLEGRDLLGLSAAQLRRLQGPAMSMVFQDALAALNPVYTVGWQIAELFRVHLGWPHKRGHDEAVELLRKVGIPNPAERAHQYPHQYSGGMRQRAMIALALALRPRLLIADEPTTALDVTVQAQVMQLLARLRAEAGMGLLLITHDIAIASEVADRIAVMYAGRVVETGAVRDMLKTPSHPYTKALVGLSTHARKSRQRPVLQGTPPNLVQPVVGCAFAPRCSHAQPLCRVEDPALRLIAAGQHAACHFAEDIRNG